MASLYEQTEYRGHHTKKSVLHWAEYIKELLENCSKTGWTAVTVDKLQLSRKFLQEVADRL